MPEPKRLVVSDYDHRDYELFALILHDAVLKNQRVRRGHNEQRAGLGIIRDIADAQARMFAEDNPAFDRAAFFAIVGIDVPTDEGTPDMS